MNDACLFCEKMSHLPAISEDELVWQFTFSVALLGPWQYYTGYCLLIARRHASELFHLASDERRGFLDEMCTLARAIDSVARPRKINYELLGNQVPHLHWHLFPRRHDDPNHLHPVWLDIDRAANDPAISKRLQMGTKPRRVIVAELRKTIREVLGTDAERGFSSRSN